MGVSFSKLRLVLYGLLGMVIGSFLTWLAFRGQDWAGILSALRQSSVPLVLLGVALVFAAGFLRAYRWHLLLPQEQVTTMRLFLVENAGVGANNVSPVRVLAAPIQFGLLVTRDKLHATRVLTSLGLQRAADVMATLALVGAGMLLLPALATLGEYVVVASITVAFLVLLSLALVWLSSVFPGLGHLAGVRLLLEVVEVARATGPRFALALVVSLVYWLSIGMVGWLIAMSLDIRLSFFVVLMLTLGIIVFSTSVPGLPGSIGSFEAATVFLLGLWAVPREVALSFGLLFHLALFLPPFLIAVVVLPLEGVRSVDALLELVGRYRRILGEEQVGGGILGGGCDE